MISPKMAKLVGYLPKDLLNFIARKIIYGYVDKYATISIDGKENLVGLNKPVIYVCNHLSNSDGLVLNKVLNEEDLTFVAGVKLSENSTTNLGVNVVKTTPLKPNSADKEGLTKIINIVKNGGNILIFPEGTRSRVGKLIKAKRGIVLIAKLTKAPIVPIGVCGTEKLLPINKEGDMGKEEFNYANVQVKIGKAINLPLQQKGQTKREYEESAVTFIMNKIAELLPEEYRGEYK